MLSIYILQNLSGFWQSVLNATLLCLCASSQDKKYYTMLVFNAVYLCQSVSDSMSYLIKSRFLCISSFTYCENNGS